MKTLMIVFIKQDGLALLVADATHAISTIDNNKNKTKVTCADLLKFDCD